MDERFRSTWKEIAGGFLKVGATGYGGPAILGVTQAEFQERRQWVTKARYLEGLALVNVLPGATAVQLCIFLGYSRGGMLGGLLAGLCFTLPGLLVMLALTMAYATLGVTPMIRGALYGLGPVVLGIFVVAVVRLGRSALRSRTQQLIAACAALAAIASPLGTVAILLLAGGVGLFLFHSRRAGTAVVVLVLIGIALAPFVAISPLGSGAADTTPGIGKIMSVFATIGALTFGGGLSMIALIQETIVTRLGWLSPEEFIAGLALGQLTPGPVLMIGAYVGYKVLGLGGAIAAIAAVFAPAFVLMVVLLPLFDRARDLAWAKAVLQGIVPSVIGVMAIALTRMTPHAVPDVFAAIVLVATVVIMLMKPIGPIKILLAGSVVGLLRQRVLAFAFR